MQTCKRNLSISPQLKKLTVDSIPINQRGRGPQKSCNACSRKPELPHRKRPGAQPWLPRHMGPFYPFSYSTSNCTQTHRVHKKRAHSADCKNGPFSFASIFAAKIKQCFRRASLLYFPYPPLLRYILPPKVLIPYIWVNPSQLGSGVP